jgi:dynein heavy chain
VLAGLSAVSNMYEYSLGAFLHVFGGSLARSKRDADLEARLRHVVAALTYDVYCYTCLGLFERHKLMLSFQMASKVRGGRRAGRRSWRRLQSSTAAPSCGVVERR